MRRISRVSVGLAVLLVLASPLGAAAQEAPTGPEPQQKAVTLTSPGVVFMETNVTIKGRVRYADSSTLSGFQTINRNYEIPWGTGSGFTVNPNGTIVTASHVVEVPKQDARNYFANEVLLREVFEYTFDSPYDQYNVDNQFVNSLLQQCYEGSACKVEVIPIVNVYSSVAVAGSELPKGLPGRVLTSTGFDATDVAVVKVEGSNMPTVPLAETAAVESGQSLTALGFAGSAQSLPSGVTEPTKLFGNVSNVRNEGTSQVIEVDIDLEPGMSGGPVVNDTGNVVGLTSYGLSQQSGESAQSYLRTVDDIRAAMADAGVTAERGNVDTSFKEAMDLYWGNHFTDSVPQFQRVLGFSDGHPLAKKYLSEAQGKAGGPDDILLDGGGFPMWILGAVAGVLVLGLLVFMLTRRKKPAAATAGVDATPFPTTEARAMGFQADAPGPAIANQQAASAYSAPTATAPVATTPPVEASPAFQSIIPDVAAVAPAAATPEPVQAAATPEPVQAAAPQPGAGEAERKFCASCGSQLTAGNAFCGSCGARSS